MVAQQAPNGHQSNGAIGGLPAATSSAHSAQLEALQDANVQLVQARDVVVHRVDDGDDEHVLQHTGAGPAVAEQVSDGAVEVLRGHRARTTPPSTGTMAPVT